MNRRLLCFLEPREIPLGGRHPLPYSYLSKLIDVRARTVRVPSSLEKQERLLAAILRFAGAHGAVGVWTED